MHRKRDTVWVYIIFTPETNKKNSEQQPGCIFMSNPEKKKKSPEILFLTLWLQIIQNKIDGWLRKRKGYFLCIIRVIYGLSQESLNQIYSIDRQVYINPFNIYM